MSTVSQEVIKIAKRKYLKISEELLIANEVETIKIEKRLDDIEEFINLLEIDEPTNLLDLKVLSLDAAKILSKSKSYSLYLEGVTEISVEAARELVKFKGGILSLGVTISTPELARELAKFRGRGYRIGGLTIEAAKEFRKCKSFDLFLYGVTDLNLELAKELAKFKVGSLRLKDLTTITTEANEELSKFKDKVKIPKNVKLT